MGRSYTRKWQIGKDYKFGKWHWLAYKESGGYVYFKASRPDFRLPLEQFEYELEHPPKPMKRKQQFGHWVR